VASHKHTLIQPSNPAHKQFIKDFMISHGIKNRHKRRFLAAYIVCGTVTHASINSKVARNNHYTWMKEDESYAKAFTDAEELAGDILEAEAMRRANDGVLEPIYQGGILVGHKRNYSDYLMKQLLEGTKPDKYKKRFEQIGKTDITIRVAVEDDVD